MKKYRDCGSEIFNTGSSKCPFNPDYIEVVVLTPDSLTIPKNNIESKIGELAHANRPGRIYPIGPIAEYAPSGGEAQTSKKGYGSSKITNYSELIETWTLNDYDLGLFNNLVSLKNESMRAFFIDRDGAVYCEDAGSENVRGFQISSVYPSGTRFKSSGSDATMSLNIVYKDVERAWKNTVVLLCEQSILESAKGLVWVDVIKESTDGSNYKVVEHYGGYDLTEMYGTVLGSAEAWDNVTASTYNPATGLLNLTVTGDVSPKLKSPEELYESGVKGIEQWF